MTQTHERYGQMLKRLRKDRKLAGWRLAKQVGTDQASVSRVENGKGRPAFPIVTTLAIADALDLPDEDRVALLAASIMERGVQPEVFAGCDPDKLHALAAELSRMGQGGHEATPSGGASAAPQQDSAGAPPPGTSSDPAES